MQWLFLVIGLLSSVTSWAVNTQECPKRFSVIYDQLIPLSEKSFKRQVQGKSAETIRELESARQIIVNQSESSKQELHFQLNEAKQAQCTYTLVGSKQKEPSRLYSRDGQDSLLLEFSVGQLLISTKHNVLSYALNELEVEHRAVTPFFLILGETKYKLGWAMNSRLSIPQSAPRLISERQLQDSL